MNLTHIRNRLDEERRTVALDSERLEHLPHITRLCAKSNAYHLVISSQLTAETADAAIENEIQYHRSRGIDFEWKLYSHDQPPDLLHRLERHGLHPGPTEAVMIFDLTTPPPWLTTDSPPAIQRVQTPDQIQTYCHLERTIFGNKQTTREQELTEALQSNSTQYRAYIACENTLPVSIARLYTHPHSHFAGLYGGGTLPTHRHRGHYRALLAARANDALESGARYLLVDALPTSRPILERFGFQHLTNTIPCQWHAKPTGVS